MLLPERGPGPQQVCLRLAGRVWVLDFVQGRFHSISAGECESVLLKAADREARKGFG